MPAEQPITPQFGEASTQEYKDHLKDSAGIKSQDIAEASARDDISNLPLRHLIGGPLMAGVHAIQEVTIGTINFVKEQCFTRGGGAFSGKSAQEMFGNKKGLDAQSGTDWGEPRYLNFEYTKTSQLGMTTPSIFRVPLLCMIPIPTLRMDYIEIDFLCKINTIETYKVGTMNAAVLKKSVETTHNEGSGNVAEGQVTGEQGDLDPINTTLGSVAAMRVNQKKTTSGSTVTKDYSYNVKVRAVDDEKTPGLEKLFEILDSLVQETSGDDATFDSLLNPMKLPQMTDFGF